MERVSPSPTPHSSTTMASSQDQRHQERLARQRGAGTHKVTNLGFTIQPLGRNLATASVAPPPPPPPPKASTPKPVTPIQEPPSRRSSRSASRNSSPTVEAATSTSRKNTGSSPLHEEATGVLSSPRTSRKLENAIPVTRRTSLRRISTPVITQSLGNVSTVSRIETPTSYVLTSHASTRSIDGRRPAVAAVTPVARGKRMRQPSPDKFLTALEAEGIDGRVGMDNMLGGESVAETEDEGANEREAREGIKEEEEEEEGRDWEGGRVREKEEEEEEEEGEEEEERERGDESYDKNATMDLDDGVMNIEEELEGRVEETEDVTVLEVGEEPEIPIIAIKSPENRNKRRKVVLQESELEETLSEQTEESIAQEQEAETLDPKRKRQTVGKKPAPRILEQEDEGEDEDEDEDEDVAQIEERQGSEEGLTELEESQDEPSRPSKKPSKLSLNRNSKHKPKPRRRTQRTSGQSGDEELASTFPVIVHRLGKSQGFILPLGSQRSGVNPIDVISQVSMEIIDKHFFKAQSNSERKAVESFKEELSLRFLELTDALENNIILTTRARQTQKRKAQLMTELLSIKQQRERIAVKMDDVRKMHEMATKSSEDQQRISKAFEDISGTLERGEARQLEEGEAGMDGLKALIRKVSTTVTGGGSDGTGLLATVAGFNRFLERAERVLSERRRL